MMWMRRALLLPEIKALCAGDPRIRERMDLDVDVSRLKLMKADHQSKQYQMEDNLLKYFRSRSKSTKDSSRGLEADMETLAAIPTRRTALPGWRCGAIPSPTKENASATLFGCL